MNKNKNEKLKNNYKMPKKSIFLFTLYQKYSTIVYNRWASKILSLLPFVNNLGGTFQ